MIKEDIIDSSLVEILYSNINFILYTPFRKIIRLDGFKQWGLLTLLVLHVKLPFGIVAVII